MKRHIFAAITLCTVILFSATIITGCDGFGAGENGGTVQVLLTDAPIDNIAEANVTIERVELVGEAGVVVLMEEDVTYDLLELQNGVTAELAEGDVPAGEYHQIRLIVQEEAVVVFDDGSDSTLKIPSGAQTGVKLNLPGGFEIGEGAEEATVVLDFDASESFVQAGASGKYIFKPVVKVENVEIEEEELEDGPEDNEVES